MLAVRRLVVLAAVVLGALALAAPSSASPGARFGIHDDAWLVSGPGTLERRLAFLQRLGVDVVRYTVRWDEVARRRPARPRSQGDPAYRWATADAVLKGLRARRIGALVTVLGAPRWANGGRASHWAPISGKAFGDFAYAAA